MSLNKSLANLVKSGDIDLEKRFLFVESAGVNALI